jgi:hypothetical protein
MAANETSFAPGNVLALKHGARSPRIVAERTQAIMADWGHLALPLSHPLDRDALWATASAVAILEDYVAWFEGADEKGRRRGAIDSRGRERGAAQRFWPAYNAVMRGLAQLGATPAGRAEMGPGVASMIRANEALKEMRGKKEGQE